MNEKIKAFQEEFNEIEADYKKFFFASRAKEFQLETCGKLELLKKKANMLKEQMIAVQDEDCANRMLSFEETIRALSNELRMWIALKEDNGNSAWGFLVNAQGAARTAMQAHKAANHLESYVEWLHALEQFLFPPQVFFSTAMIIESSKCSICGQECGSCQHVKGKAYMGKICVEIVTKVKKVNEVAMVKQPGSKHCRVVSIRDESGIKRDFLTWRAISSSSTKGSVVLHWKKQRGGVLRGYFRRKTAKDNNSP